MLVNHTAPGTYVMYPFVTEDAFTLDKLNMLAQYHVVELNMDIAHKDFPLIDDLPVWEYLRRANPQILLFAYVPGMYWWTIKFNATKSPIIASTQSVITQGNLWVHDYSGGRIEPIPGHGVLALNRPSARDALVSCALQIEKTRVFDGIRWDVTPSTPHYWQLHDADLNANGIPDVEEFDGYGEFNNQMKNGMEAVFAEVNTSTSLLQCANPGHLEDPVSYSQGIAYANVLEGTMSENFPTELWYGPDNQKLPPRAYAAQHFFNRLTQWEDERGFTVFTVVAASLLNDGYFSKYIRNDAHAHRFVAGSAAVAGGYVMIGPGLMTPNRCDELWVENKKSVYAPGEKARGLGWLGHQRMRRSIDDSLHTALFDNGFVVVNLSREFRKIIIDQHYGVSSKKIGRISGIYDPLVNDGREISGEEAITIPPYDARFFWVEPQEEDDDIPPNEFENLWGAIRNLEVKVEDINRTVFELNSRMDKQDELILATTARINEKLNDFDQKIQKNSIALQRITDAIEKFVSSWDF